MLNLCKCQSWKFVCLIPALLIGMAGCVTTGDTADSNPLAALFPTKEPKNLSPEERQMREDANVFRDTVLGGAATIAGTAGLACMLKYGFDRDNLKKCAAVAAAGGVLGAIDGYRTAKKQEASRNKVREIDLITQEVEQRNAAAQRMLESSRKVVEQNRERISEVKLQVAQNEVREEQLVEEKNRLQANIDVMNKSIGTLEQDKQTYQALADKLEMEGQDVAGLRSQVESMNLQIAALEQERNALEEINQTVRIG